LFQPNALHIGIEIPEAAHYPLARRQTDFAWNVKFLQFGILSPSVMSQSVFRNTTVTIGVLGFTSVAVDIDSSQRDKRFARAAFGYDHEPKLGGAAVPRACRLADYILVDGSRTSSTVAHYNR
jgi:hypothetical protein